MLLDTNTCDMSYQDKVALIHFAQGNNDNAYQYQSSWSFHNYQDLTKCPSKYLLLMEQASASKGTKKICMFEF